MPELYPFEKRIAEAENLELRVWETKFNSSLKGLCIDDVIIIDKRLSWTEKNCVLAEEIGHALFSIGDITDLRIAANRKQERQARTYAYRHLVSLHDLIRAYKFGCNCLYEAAEYLDVTEDFLREVFQYYLSRYGSNAECEGYKIKFSEYSVYIESGA